MIPLIIVVIIGTFFLFTQLSVYLINFLRKRKNILWIKTNMILLSYLSFRMQYNARTFFMVVIISTVTFSAIGKLCGFQTYLTGGVKEGNPYTFTYVADEENGNQTKQDIEKIDQILEERAIEAKRVTTELERSEEHTSELQSRFDLVCRLLLEKKK